ncbi:MAG: SemiSWEET transporter [Candidatus Kapabacteria bacterium]|nr:SemiSWEET transporter [Ignavibacteriota bacterium]MCW5884354.1 SemiSWEET transporter [Candidatus Kapabacteria bacterium]
MDVVSIYGYLGATCTTVSFIPQIIKILKEKEAKDISIGMYLIFTFGVMMWLVYGILLNEYPIIIANTLTLSFAVTILILKNKYG